MRTQLITSIAQMLRRHWFHQGPAESIGLPRTGRRIVYGCAHVDGTAAPGESGNCVISASRETQFAVLYDIDIGDEIIIETRAGPAFRYRVRSIRIVRRQDTAVLRDLGDRRLTLITCYPSRRELRYAVVATAA